MRILVLGGSGMWGHQVFLKMKKHFGVGQVACTLHKPVSHFAKFGIYEGCKVYDRADFSDFNQATKVLQDYQPTIILNCVGLTPRKHDIQNQELYRKVNSELPYHLLQWAQKNSARLIHFSTDCVFSGKKGEYTEADIPDATDVYGSSKAKGEINDPSALTLRLSKIGREIEYKTELLEWFLAQRGKAAQGFSKAFYSGLTTNFMAKELIRIIEKFPNLNGLYQISSQKISKYELLKLINQTFDCQVEIQEKSDYAVDKSLNCELYIQKTGFQKPTWPDMLLELKNEDGKLYDSLI